MKLPLPFRLVAPVLVLLVTATCGDDDGVDVVPVASVTVSPAAFELAPGGTQQLSVVAADANGQELSGRTVTFISSDEEVAEVSGSGLVTAVAEGNATITAESEGVQGTATVTVTPAPVAAVTVDPAAAELEVGQEVQLTAVVEDADGNELDDRPVTWSSGDEDVATVDQNGLVTAVGGGEAAITAAAEGVEGTATITVIEDFEPSADTEIEGSPVFGAFTIPAGVTVTVTGPLEVEVRGDVELAGTLTADCHPVTLRGEGSVVVSGTVTNECVADPDTDAPGDLLIVAGTGYEIDGATLTTSGNGEVTNNESLTDDDFAPSALRARARQAGAGECPVRGSFLAGPAQASGGSGQEGDAGGGGNGSTWTLRCEGNMTVTGTATVTAQDGGDGGAATGEDNGEGDVSARGGDGGDGGDVRVQATGDIDFTGQNGGMTLRLTRGGHGGSAEATATAPGGDAAATGGNGGDAGSFRVEAGGSISISPGGLTIEVGNGGNGGEGTATAADGEDAGDEVATPGGDASATGGAGGNTPDGQLRASGSVSGLANVEVTGADGGAGGAASAHGGKGGDGNQQFPDGADGGSMEANGGAGGSSLTGDAGGTIVGGGGDGGAASLSGGLGGTGWDGCSVDPPEAGGNGGMGGAGAGSGGAPGTGNPDGTHGDITVAGGTGNGGDGGDGEGPGSGGPGGDDSGIDPADGTRIDEGENFQDGEDGEECPPPAEEEEVKAQVMPSSVSSSSGQVSPGDYEASLRAEEGAGDQVAQMLVSSNGPDNAVDADNEWFLSTGPSFWGFDLSSIVGVAGAEVTQKTSVEVCHPDPFAGLQQRNGPAPVTADQPLEARFYDHALEIIATHLLTEVGACGLFDIPVGAVFLHLVGPEQVLVNLELFIIMRMLMGV